MGFIFSISCKTPKQNKYYPFKVINFTLNRKTGPSTKTFFFLILNQKAPIANTSNSNSFNFKIYILIDFLILQKKEILSTFSFLLLRNRI